MIRARMKTDAGWHDACIVDLSKRGAGLQAATAPMRGDYVEIRRGLHVIVARVVWNRGHRFGVAAQDELPVANIANDRAPTVDRKAAASPVPKERRRLPRFLEEKAERSRSRGQRMQYVFAALAGMIAATIAGAEVRQALAAPLGRVSSALER
ncbi:hypothetical protein G7076_07570 [Sphingomonas sp. HDW15A]|uniref:hypothetical protein n=1 Tax=Sphingomonas sp. HDW15A TaxID=2714942 RepID=UPI00140E4A68|nr:hypothetical protein [Sphingomonas sp. HDW15A]QIK96324.1 hypothetical protein G7076_07570 [Sphingomonas sp. HDW15A]